ncbi:hypothetical protein Oweho_1273 [Owenweeksia hongkongensis DSM 17368]|uniref:DUF4197 domain-containing protein n=1 Tax=Owenweeksia hongkongensis (strain DSM 17368 / CIP 108786 / JCM 12287 / NRRL B-23963 / UST20020801) TaxID=926562 RepID=G8R6T8_OWEHD|nr:DUF4197 domain-containing protein [Owenweeksia hongkongensis]AEV32273.1 hypothetical protein Oweho_1273 [Owenweeksia hongkongensis DSM 17368]
MRLVLSTLLAFCLLSCDQLNTLVENAGSTLPPTESEISNGIREALIVGAKNAINETSKKNGFLNNSLIKIPFPAEAQKVEKAARDLGLDAQVDQFIETMNHGAEQASAKATDIFISSIKQMTLQDVYDIWRGDNDAATQYLIRTTSDRLRSEFRPVIKQSLDKVQMTKYWSPLVDNYNKIPFVTKVNPDLDEYVLDETLEGLFVVIAQEEASIRENPQARVSEILQRVFGYNDGNF